MSARLRSLFFFFHLPIYLKRCIYIFWGAYSVPMSCRFLGDAFVWTMRWTGQESWLCCIVPPLDGDTRSPEAISDRLSGTTNVGIPSAAAVVWLSYYLLAGKEGRTSRSLLLQVCCCCCCSQPLCCPFCWTIDIIIINIEQSSTVYIYWWEPGGCVCTMINTKIFDSVAFGVVGSWFIIPFGAQFSTKRILVYIYLFGWSSFSRSLTISE